MTDELKERHILITTADIVELFERIEELSSYLKEYKFKYSIVINRMFEKAVEDNNTTYLDKLLKLFGDEDFWYFANSNNITVKSLNKGRINILQWLHNTKPLTDITSFKTAAASNGNVDVLKFLQSLNPHWSFEAYECASYFYVITHDEKYKECLEFMIETKYPLIIKEVRTLVETTNSPIKLFKTVTN
jgi:hypothetical protein